MSVRALDRRSAFSWLALALVAMLALGTWASKRPWRRQPPAAMNTGGETLPAQRAREAHARFVSVHRAQGEQALQRAKIWLDRIKLDPDQERALGVGQYQQLVELLFPYVRLYRVSSGTARQALKARASAIVAPSLVGRYAELAALDDQALHRDAIAYLRAGYLIEQLELDATRYRLGLSAALPRLQRERERADVAEQLSFAWYDAYFGLHTPLEAKQVRARGLIAQRADPARFGAAEREQLTHEVSIAYRFGEQRDARVFSKQDQQYLQRALTSVASYAVQSRDSELTARAVSCLAYLQLDDRPEYGAAFDYLLSTQRPDGAFGEPRQPTLHSELLSLHATQLALVAVLDALSILGPAARDDSSVPSR